MLSGSVLECVAIHQQQVTDENGPTIAFRVTELNSVSAQSEELRTELVTDCEKPDQSLDLRNFESVKQESASSDSGDSNLVSTLYSEGFRYSAVSALNCAHLIQF
ncbi:hypothetical protein J6590_101644 [Homalodisca vitripennis]|nr:hypothetical protein J6590_101644 [Homalodisca vitripennis]